MGFACGKTLTLLDLNHTLLTQLLLQFMLCVTYVVARMGFDHPIEWVLIPKLATTQVNAEGCWPYCMHFSCNILYYNTVSSVVKTIGTNKGHQSHYLPISLQKNWWGKCILLHQKMAATPGSIFISNITCLMQAYYLHSVSLSIKP